MTSRNATNRNRNAAKLRKLERALIKAALVRYAEWQKVFSGPNPWGKHPNVKTKKAWDLLMAAKRLYEASR